MNNAMRFYAYKALSLALYCIPLSVLLAVNHEAYIYSEGARLGFFGYIILTFVIIAFKSKFTELAKKNTILTVSLVVFVIAIIMQYLAEQLILISGASLLGCVLSAVVEPVADVYFTAAYKVENGIKRKLYAKRIAHKAAWRMAFGFPVLTEDQEHGR